MKVSLIATVKSVTIALVASAAVLSAGAVAFAQDATPAPTAAAATVSPLGDPGGWVAPTDPTATPTPTGTATPNSDPGGW